VATNRNLPASIMKLGSFLSALLSSLDSDDIALVKSDSTLFLTDTHPSKRFLAATAGFRSLVLLSATISPPSLFLRSIGLDETSTILHSATTSYKFRIRTVIDSGVTTRFKMRTAEMYWKITERVAAICNSVPGGVGVFLPSYAVLGSVSGPLRSRIERGTTTAQPGRTLIIERPGLSNEDSEEMMNTFKSRRGCVLLAIQGGRFSEGEDFPGDEMDVSIVVGLPLPPPSPTTYAEYKQMEVDRLDKHQAYMVLSLLPALRRAFQCAGRHVREPGKVGMVFFMDSRFAEQRIIDLMPSWLREDLLKGEFGPESISSVTREFFSSARGR
jgi:DNA excision repair protein ERCC-2